VAAAVAVAAEAEEELLQRRLCPAVAIETTLALLFRLQVRKKKTIVIFLLIF